MDPNACMQRILKAMATADREEYEDAGQDLLEWLKIGGFPPVFTTEMATLGHVPIDQVRHFIPFRRTPISIQTVNIGNDLDGWELVEWGHRSGKRMRSWRLAAK